MPFNLNIIAHINLPGNYRLIRVKSAELCQFIQPGDTLYPVKSNCSLPYFRHDPIEEKIDFLFYLSENNNEFSTGKMLTATLEHVVFPSKQAFNLLVCQLINLGKGLSIAQSKTNITLSLFELGSASPFKLQPSRFYLPNMAQGVIANMAFLDDAGIVARFCSQANLPGCFDGSLSAFVTSIKMNDSDDTIFYV